MSIPRTALLAASYFQWRQSATEACGVSMYRRDTRLVFQAQPAQGYTSIGGNPKARETNYDLVKSIQGIDDLTLPVVSLGPSTTIPHKEAIPPWTERHSTLLWIILVLAVGMMLILIVRNLKKHPSDISKGKTLRPWNDSGIYQAF